MSGYRVFYSILMLGLIYKASELGSADRYSFFSVSFL